jgi:DNA-binding GntR family transcriptional regulator
MIAKGKKTTTQKSKMDFQSFVSRIENMILTGTFKPRERLIEAALSEMFGVSRYIVRDAFKVLETKGLVTVTPFRGVVVSELGRQEVEELFVIRAALEQVALRLSTQNTTTVDIKVLRRMVKKIEDAHHDDDFVAMVAADTTFHDYVFQISRNETLRRMINDLRNRCHIIRYSAWSSPTILQQVMEEHRLIVDAIEARDVAALNELSERHISHAKVAYLFRLKAENALLK